MQQDRPTPSRGESTPFMREVLLTDTDINTNLNNDEEVFESLVVLEFSLKVPPPSIQWILEKVKLSKSKGGSELLVCPIVDENHEVYTVLLFL